MSEEMTRDHIGDVNEMVLRRCPFCGGEAKVVPFVSMNESLVECSECEAKTTMFHGIGKRCISAWNRRAPEPEPDWEQIFSEPSPFLMTMQEDGKLMEMVRKALGRDRGDDKNDKPRPKVYGQGRRRTPEPGTSVVRWVRYGDEKPKEQVLVCVSGINEPVVLFEDMWVDNTDSFVRHPIDGDLWSHLPEPPEGMG